MIRYIIKIKIDDRFVSFNKLRTWETIKKTYILDNKNRKNLKSSIPK